MQAKTERFELRLDQAVLDDVDLWRAQQPDLPSRSEAIRRLVETGIAPKVQFSNGERLIIIMLRDLYKHLKVKGEINPDFIASVLYGGHYWALDTEWGEHLFHRHQDKRETVTDVVNILDMWSFIEEAYEELDKRRRDHIAEEAGSWGKDVRFHGFDGNHEIEHMSVARFMIEDMDRFERFKKRDLNSHVPSVARYRRMYRVFDPIRTTLIGKKLTVAQLTEILKAQEEPFKRRM